MPQAVHDTLTALGRDIRRARIRRRISSADLALRSLVSRPTILKVEKGDPSVSFGTVVHVLWVMGLLDRVSGLLRDDPVGESLEGRNARVRVGRKDRKDEFDF